MNRTPALGRCSRTPQLAGDGLLCATAYCHRGAKLFRLEPSWYGFDPIHIRPTLWRTAWSRILGVDPAPGRSTAESLRLYLMRPERQWLAGREQVTPQVGTSLRAGGRIWLC